jgi:hypothetical protein
MSTNHCNQDIFWTAVNAAGHQRGGHSLRQCLLRKPFSGASSGEKSPAVAWFGVRALYRQSADGPISFSLCPFISEPLYCADLVRI